MQNTRPLRRSHRNLIKKAVDATMWVYEAADNRPKDRRALLETTRQECPQLHRAVVRRLWRRELAFREANRCLRRCESPIWNRRPVHRTPARSIGARTKSARKRSGTKPTSIGDDPVSPRRASSGGAW